MPKGVYKKTLDHKRKISNSLKGRKQSQETRDKRSKSRRRISRETRVCVCGNKFECRVTSTQKFCSRSCVSKGKKLTQEAKDKISKGNTGKKRTQEMKDKISKGNTGKHRTNEAREKQKQAQIKRWSDPEYREVHSQAMLEGLKASPNYPEQLLFDMLNRLFPGKYLLNVKGEHIKLNNKRPDIVNLKDKKLIEHYGCKWHGDLEFWKLNKITEVNGLSLKEIHVKDKVRLDSFRKLGWKPLIVWNHELQDIEKLEDKLVKFHKDR